MQGWLRCPPEAGAGRGKSRVSSPRRSTGYPVSRRCPGAGRRRQPSLFEEADGEPSGPRLRAAPFRSMGQGCSVRRLSSTVQGVFHRLVVRKGGTGPDKRRWRRLLVPRACARAVGMGLGVESSGGPGLWFPLGFGSSFGFRLSGWPVEGEYSTCVQVWSRGSCHFWGAGATDRQVRPPPLDPSTELRVSGPSAPGMDSGSAGSAPSGGMVSCLRRNDGGGVGKTS